MSRILLNSLARFALHPWFRLTRGGTLGVRAVVLDPQQGVLLVRHSYAPGWQFPGGGVERVETCTEALYRELREEAGVTLEAPPELFGVYANHAQFPGDHLVVFIVRAFTLSAPARTLEIAEARFFALDSLPSDVTAGTARRIEEVAGRRKPDGHW
jgi:ADP-ribose pyrophosphatase YjhB (NUDIX family)